MAGSAQGLRPSRELRIDGRPLRIFDNQLADVAAYVQGLSRASFTRSEYARPETIEHKHWATEVKLEALLAQPIYEVTRRAVLGFEGEGFGYRPYRAYTNVASFGDMLFTHTDCLPDQHDLTALWYLCERWDLEWGGETMFFDAQDEIACAVLPKPGRLRSSTPAGRRTASATRRGTPSRSSSSVPPRVPGPEAAMGAAAAAPSAAQLDDARWFAFDLHVPERRFAFVRLEEDVVARSSFLDTRIEAPPGELSWVDAEAIPAQLPNAAPSWLFHTSFCGSTLLARMLHLPPHQACLREPLVLRRLADAQFAQVAMDGLPERSIALLSRPWHPGGGVLVKPTHAALNIAERLLAGSGDSRGVILRTGGLPRVEPEEDRRVAGQDPAPGRAGDAGQRAACAASR